MNEEQYHHMHAVQDREETFYFKLDQEIYKL